MGKIPQSGLEITTLKMWHTLDESRCTLNLGTYLHISCDVTSAEYFPVGLLSAAINKM